MVKLPDELIQSFKERRKQEASLGLRGYGRKRIVDALAEIDDALKDVADPAVRSHDQEAPGLLALLDHVVAADRYNEILSDYAAMDALEDLASAIGISFELGKYAAGDRSGAEALRERLLRGPNAAGDKKRREANRWRDPAKRIWRELRATKRSISQPHLAAIIKAEVPAARSVSERQIIETIRLWVRELGS